MSLCDTHTSHLTERNTGLLFVSLWGGQALTWVRFSKHCFPASKWQEGFLHNHSSCRDSVPKDRATEGMTAEMLFFPIFSPLRCILCSRYAFVELARQIRGLEKEIFLHSLCEIISQRKLSNVKGRI